MEWGGGRVLKANLNAVNEVHAERGGEGEKGRRRSGKFQNPRGICSIISTHTRFQWIVYFFNKKNGVGGREGERE
jgi:hypothetical protein